MNKIKIPLYKPYLIGNEKKYVNQCLDSTWISSKGNFISKFEQKFSNFIKVKYVTTATNGTCALHLSLLALGLKEGDEVIVPSLTYIASVNAISYVGAKPIFVDSLSTTWQMDPDDIRKKITSKTRAILCVHLYGHPCDMNKITKIAKENNLFLIEDCAEAIGSYFDNKHVGIFGDISTFSFYGNKTITTGEGGMVATNNHTIYEKVLKLKGQGLAKNKEYWHDIIGYNYRMTNICAAIGLAQLENIEIILTKKRNIAHCYKNYLLNTNIEFQKNEYNVINSYWMFSVLFENEQIKEQIRQKLIEVGIETRTVFHPIHMMPMYKNINLQLKISERLSSLGINLPSWPGLKNNQIKFICNILQNLLSTSRKTYALQSNQ